MHSYILHPYKNNFSGEIQASRDSDMSVETNTFTFLLQASYRCQMHTFCRTYVCLQRQERSFGTLVRHKNLRTALINIHLFICIWSSADSSWFPHVVLLSKSHLFTSNVQKSLLSWKYWTWMSYEAKYYLISPFYIVFSLNPRPLVTLKEIVTQTKFVFKRI